jgi:hypothetical protein
VKVVDDGLTGFEVSVVHVSLPSTMVHLLDLLAGAGFGVCKHHVD